jgi:hypothetical protein
MISLGVDLDPKLRKLKRSRDESLQNDDDEEEEPGYKHEFLIDPSSLASKMRTGKASKVERLRRVLEGIQFRY